MNQAAKNHLEAIRRLRITIEIWESELRFIAIVKQEYNLPSVSAYEDHAREQVAQLTMQRNAIIGQIQAMEHDRHREFLYKRYVEEKPLEKIADEMFYEPDSARRLHGKAVQDFANLYSIRE